jgi:AcrR family transcriptional regulator
MPKISAPTVAEHRARQRAALLEAAIETLVEQGADAVTPAAVTARAGLSRPSFYQYFPSSAALLATIVEDAFTAADQASAEALHGVDQPAARIDTFVRTELRLAHEGLHRPAAALARADLPHECRQRVSELHQQHYRPLLEALHELDLPDPSLTARLLAGLLQAACSAVENGHSHHETADRTLTLLHHGLSRPEVETSTSTRSSIR